MIYKYNGMTITGMKTALTKYNKELKYYHVGAIRFNIHTAEVFYEYYKNMSHGDPFRGYTEPDLVERIHNRYGYKVKITMKLLYECIFNYLL